MTEILLVFLTAVASEICVSVFNARGPFIIAATAFWVGYVIVRWWRDPGALRRWGFGTENLGPASAAAGGVFVLGSAGMLAWAALWGGGVRPVPWGHVLPVLVLYPAWGLVQQFLLDALVARNLLRWLSPVAVVVLTAGLFGMVHLPAWTLVSLSFAVALAWVPIYLRWRNLWPLGVCHGWLGAVTYFVILHRDPWAEFTAVLR